RSLSRLWMPRPRTCVLFPCQTLFRSAAGRARLATHHAGGVRRLAGAAAAVAGDPLGGAAGGSGGGRADRNRRPGPYLTPTDGPVGGRCPARGADRVRCRGGGAAGDRGQGAGRPRPGGGAGRGAGALPVRGAATASLPAAPAA